MVTVSTDYNGNRRTASEVVISTIAEAGDLSPTEFDRPLYDTVDPEALNRLLESDETPPESSPILVQFTYCGFRVRIDDNTITVGNDHE